MIEPYYCAPGLTLYLGDCIDVMRELPTCSVDAIVTDPPYNLAFMGKAFDTFTGPREFQQWCEAWAREAYRVLKPGGHIAAFGGTRTHHRLVCGIEDAGFEIRDECAYMFGSGFPKSLDVSKAIDRMNGDARPVIGEWHQPGRGQRAPVQAYGLTNDHGTITSAASAASADWQGWGTALKPAHEPICLARKPLIGTVAKNVLAHGTGALNIDGTRIAHDGTGSWGTVNRNNTRGVYGSFGDEDGETPGSRRNDAGRWPANVILDEEASALLDQMTGELASSHDQVASRSANGWFGQADYNGIGFNDRGGASRFFYTAKASRSEREAGLDDLPPSLRTDGRDPGGVGGDNPRLRVSERRNDHPTVKPVSLMRWLCKLITPPSGVILDPFLGSGTTALAALDEGFECIGIDMTERYVEIARYRATHRHVIDHEVREANEATPQGRLL